MTILQFIHQSIDSPLQRKNTRPMTMWLHTAISDLFYSFYDGSSDGAVQSEITDVTKMDSVSAKDRADAIPKVLMPPEKVSAKDRADAIPKVLMPPEKVSAKDRADAIPKVLMPPE